MPAVPGRRVLTHPSVVPPASSAGHDPLAVAIDIVTHTVYETNTADKTYAWPSVDRFGCANGMPVSHPVGHPLSGHRSGSRCVRRLLGLFAGT
jgi:hypothetical protein